MTDTLQITPEMMDQIKRFRSHPLVAGWLRERQKSWATFVPRPDDPKNFDQQHSFCYNRDSVSFLVGGNAAGCLGAEQRVFDPVAGKSLQVSEIDKSFHVWAIDSHGRKVIANASRPKVYGIADLHEIKLSNGESFIATLGHRVLDSHGNWQAIGRLLGEPNREPAAALCDRFWPASSAFRLALDLHSLTAMIDQAIRQFVSKIDCIPNTIAAWLQSASRAVDYNSSSVAGEACRASLLPLLQSLAGFGWRDIRLDRGQLDVRCCFGTIRDSRFDCRPFLRFDGGLLRLPLDSGQGAIPLLGDVQRRSPCNLRTDDLATSRKHSHRGRLSDRLSSSDSSRQQSPVALSSSAFDSPVEIVDARFLRRDEYWDFSVERHKSYELSGIFHHNTTEAAAFKTSLLTLRQQPPPRRNTPFWIISNTLEQSCDVCWGEKLLGHGHIPECEIDWDGVTWLDKRREWPATVPLKPWPTERGGSPTKNWTLNFKSFEQGRQAMQARSIGGFWFSEQFPLDIFLEVLRGCREYMFPGAQFAEFTPIDPELSIWVEEIMEKPPEGWAFYRANTLSNRPNLAEGWFEQFFGTVSEEMRDTRQTGQLASFEGVIYPNFDREIHVVDESEIVIPPGAYRGLGTDWGASAEHPFATVFGYRDGLGCWWIVDEYWSTDQTQITIDHANNVLDICDQWGWPVIEDKATSRSGRRIAGERDPFVLPNFADPSRPGEMNAFSAYGIPTMPASNAVYDGIQHVRDLLKFVEPINSPRLVISSRCRHLINELRKYRWRRGAKPRGGTTLNPSVAKPEPLKRDDDTADAMRYLVFTGDRQGGEVPQSGRSQSEGRVNRSIQLRRQANRAVGMAERTGVFQRNGRH